MKSPILKPGRIFCLEEEFTMKTTAMVLAASLAAFVPVQAQAPESAQDMIRKVESEIVQTIQIGTSSLKSVADKLKEMKIPGLSVAVVKGFAVHWAKGYGVRDSRTGEPVTEETLFQVASITKTISAIVTLRLVQDGILDLDRNVNDYLKSWKVPENEWTKIEKVTLRRILSHTAGLTVSGFRGYAEGEPVPTIIQVLDGVPPANNGPVRVERVPGSGFKYSGGGYTILQVLLEDVTGRPLPELAAEHVFKPAGMTRSAICLCSAPSLESQAALGHSKDGAPFKGYTFLQGGSGCCELWTTPSDLARLVIALQKSLRGDAGALLSQSTARKMMDADTQSGAGLGIFIRRFGDAAYFNHDGGNVGFVSRFLGHPDKGYGLAIVINTDSQGTMIRDLTGAVGSVYDWEGFAKK
jgi:CubicO group peptidase (beta-lactamase class C family)